MMPFKQRNLTLQVSGDLIQIKLDKQLLMNSLIIYLTELKHLNLHLLQEKLQQINHQMKWQMKFPIRYHQIRQ